MENSVTELEDKIQTACLELSKLGVETVVISVSVSSKTVVCYGSDIGHTFLNYRKELPHQFLSFSSDHCFDKNATTPNHYETTQISSSLENSNSYQEAELEIESEKTEGTISQNLIDRICQFSNSSFPVTNVDKDADMLSNKDISQISDQVNYLPLHQSRPPTQKNVLSMQLESTSLVQNSSSFQPDFQSLPQKSYISRNSVSDFNISSDVVPPETVIIMTDNLSQLKNFAANSLLYLDNLSFYTNDCYKVNEPKVARSPTKIVDLPKFDSEDQPMVRTQKPDLFEKHPSNQVSTPVCPNLHKESVYVEKNEHVVQFTHQLDTENTNFESQQSHQKEMKLSNQETIHEADKYSKTRLVNVETKLVYDLGQKPFISKTPSSSVQTELIDGIGQKLPSKTRTLNVATELVGRFEQVDMLGQRIPSKTQSFRMETELLNDLGQKATSKTSSVSTETELVDDFGQKPASKTRSFDVETELVDVFGQKPYRCSLCGVRFTCVKNLYNHKKRMHAPGVVKYKCDACETSFGSQKSLDKHLNLHLVVEGKYNENHCSDDSRTSSGKNIRSDNKEDIISSIDNDKQSTQIIIEDDTQSKKSFTDDDMHSKHSLTEEKQCNLELLDAENQNVNKDYTNQTEFTEINQSLKSVKQKLLDGENQNVNKDYTNQTEFTVKQDHVYSNAVSEKDTEKGTENVTDTTTKRTSSRISTLRKKYMISETATRHLSSKSKFQTSSEVLSLNENVLKETDRPNMTDKYDNRNEKLHQTDNKQQKTESQEATCHVCNLNFRKIKSLKEHLKKIHSVYYKCSNCSSTFQSEDHLNKHKISNCGDKGLKCGMCGKIFAKRYNMQRHMETIHKPEKAFKCQKCSKEFKSMDGLKRHLITHNATRKCDICGKEFLRYLELVSHKAAEHRKETAPLICNICNKQYRTKQNLNRHLRLHRGEKPFECNMCDKRFAAKETLKCHRNTHIKSTIHLCDICGKEFMHKTSLLVHKKCHSGEKYQKCQYCGKYLASKQGLQSHMVSFHAQEKDVDITGNSIYQCEFCGKIFTEKQRYKIHKYIHTGEKPYRCDDCGRGFNHPRNLKAHMVTHKKIRAYTCSDCGKTFKQKKDLNRHLKLYCSVRKSTSFLKTHL